MFTGGESENMPEKGLVQGGGKIRFSYFSLDLNLQNET